VHVLCRQSRRLRAINEIARVLRQGGRALIYVWAKNQQKDKQKSSYLKQQCTNAAVAAEESQQPPSSPFSLPVHTNRTQFCHSDLLVPWKLRAQHGEYPKWMHK
jgi:alkylated DNA repair protein alkB homolog 8